MRIRFKSTKKKTHKKGASFYRRENLIQTVDELKNILSHLGSSNATKTTTNIIFKGVELDAISLKNLLSDFGDESFLLEPESGITGHKIHYYRFSSQHLRFLI